MDRKEFLETVKQDGYALENAETKFKKDKEIVLAAVKQNGLVLRYADKSLKKDKEVVLEAVKQDGGALKHADKKLQDDKEILTTKTKINIKKFKKKEQEAFNNTDESGYYMDEFDYCLGNLAEDLCSAGEKEWARKIYKVVEEKLDRSQIDSEIYLNLAEDVATYLGDKEWARKIYKEAEGSVDKDALADSIIENLGDKEWAKKIQKN